MHSMLRLITIAFALLPLARAEDAKEAGNKPALLPVPPAAAQAEAERQIKATLKDDYAKRAPADRVALAKRLLQIANETKGDAATLYVALREAKDSAVAAGDLQTAFTAVDILGWSFAVDADDLKSAAVAAVSRTVATPAAAEAAVTAGLALLDQLTEGARFDAAAKLATALEDLARRTNDAAMLATVRNRAKDVRAQQAEWAKVKPFLDKLKTSPDDADAALGAGKFYASLGDWDRALPLLARAAVPALKDAAAKDAAQPADAAARAELADLWWSLSEKEIGAFKPALQNRGAHWYGQALDGLTGMRKLLAEKRMQTAAAAGSPAGGPAPTAGLVFWVNAAGTGNAQELVSKQAGAETGPAPLITDAGVKALRFKSSYMSYAVGDAVKNASARGSVFVCFKCDDTAQRTGMMTRGDRTNDDISLWLVNGKIMARFNFPPSKTTFTSQKSVAADKWNLCGATWDGKTVTLYVNGERDSVHPSTDVPLSRCNTVTLGANTPGSIEYYGGLIGSVMLYNRALTDAEAKQLFLASPAGRPGSR
jgi:hypothetical protein